MRNADKPAMPLPNGATFPNGKTLDIDGLTKREMFAMYAMQGLLSVNATYNGKTDARDLLSKDAVAHADALLAELEK